MDKLCTLSQTKTSSELRRVALSASGIFLSPYLLVDARTGMSANLADLRAIVASAFAGGPTGHFERLRQAVRVVFWDHTYTDPKQLAFEAYLRIRLTIHNQRRVTRLGGHASLTPTPLHPTALHRLRSRLLRRDIVLRGPAGVLVLFDRLGHERSSIEAVRAARDAVVHVYGK
jgi:hypothetical protein